MRLLIANAEGQTIERYVVPTRSAVRDLGAGEMIVEYAGPEAIEDVETYLAGDVLATRSRVLTMNEARAARWAEAIAYRNARQDGGCATPLGRVQTDADSQRKVNGAVTAALVAQVTGAPFAAIDWTMEDNSVVAHDAPALIAMGMAVVAYLDACQQAGTAIRALIDAAEDQAALDAIDITAGYPT